MQGYENNLHANDAPVSFPPVWTVPWLWWAQYDASIEQPLIRNAGEALGVPRARSISRPTFRRTGFSARRSRWKIWSASRRCCAVRDPFGRTPKGFGGLTSPKWPSHLFPDDPAWKINPERVAKGRALYANICAECHLGPVADPAFDTQFPDKSFWSTPSKHWKQDPNGGWILNEVQKSAAIMGTDPAQANVLATRQVQIPGFLTMQPASDLGKRWNCKDMATYSSTEMPFSIALMIMVDTVSQKWLTIAASRSRSRSRKLWGQRTNCPNTRAQRSRTIARGP